MIVIDSSKALHDVVEPDGFRRSIYDLASKVAYSDAVLLLVGEYSPEETRSEPEFAVADGIVQLENEAYGPVDRRWLRVLKMRGAEIVPGQHSFRITQQGFEVFPRLETTLPAACADAHRPCSFGDAKLDAATGGGIPRGDSTLLIGPSGVGKTLLGLQFIAAGVAQGERCLHISFQETADQVREKAAAAGHDWSSVPESQLVIRQIPPVELDLDEVGALSGTSSRRARRKRVVIDSLAELAFSARETERLPAYVWALGGFVRAVGGTTIFTNEMAALGRGSDLGRPVVHLQQRLLPPLRRDRVRASPRAERAEDAAERAREGPDRVHDRRERDRVRRSHRGRQRDARLERAAGRGRRGPALSRTGVTASRVRAVSLSES